MIVVCGEALIDLIPVEDGSERSTPGGGPFNTARALARLEIPTQFLGRLSKDTYGQMLAELLVADGADLSLTSFGPEPSTLAIASVDASGLAVYRFVSEGTSAPNLTSAMLPETMAPDVKALHVGTLGLVLEPFAALAERDHGLVELAAAHGHHRFGEIELVVHRKGDDPGARGLSRHVGELLVLAVDVGVLVVANRQGHRGVVPEGLGSQVLELGLHQNLARDRERARGHLGRRRVLDLSERDVEARVPELLIKGHRPRHPGAAGFR